MKKLLVFFLAVSLFAACDNNKSKDSKRERSSESRTKDDYRSDDKSSDEKSSDDRTSDEKEKSREDQDTRSGWASSDEDKFMNDCEGTATANVGAERAREYCDCMLKKIKKMYSSYTEADRELAGSSQTELNRMANECNGK